MQFDYVIRSSVYISEEELSEMAQLMAEGMDLDDAMEEAIEDDDRLYLVGRYAYDALQVEMLRRIG
jgi:type II secretory pathway component PulK